MNKKTSGERLRRLIDTTRMKHKAFADLCNIAPGTLSRLINGKIELTPPMAARLAPFLNTSVEYLLGETDVKSPKSDSDDFSDWISSTLEITSLPTAKEAFEQTKEPQLKKCIDAINNAMKNGLTHAYVADREKLHQETIDYLTEKGYDISVTCFKKNDAVCRERDEYFNHVYWHEDACGSYSYEEK